MSTKNTKTVTLEDLEYITMPNGLLCFMGNREDICDIVESLGYQQYYVIADSLKFKEYTKTETAKWENGVHRPATTTTVTEEQREMALIKIVKNMIGRTAQVSEDEFGQEFAGIEIEATYHLPKIPKILIKKLDEFFRLVDAQHGTESIVLLTFDDSKSFSSDSWGILVPKQENTSVHCKYDPDSIVDLKPFHVSIVGSVHSHPGMAAYASGTDHQDQADFDGIHITFGWQKTVNNNATQYHIEMQMSGTAYTLKPEDVFEMDDVVKEPDPEVVKWTENVSKKAYPPYTTTGVTKELGHSNQQYSNRGLDHLDPYRKKNYSTNTGYDVEELIRSKKFGPTAIVAVELPREVCSLPMIHCPVCEWELSNVDLQNGICSGCETYLATHSQTAHEVIETIKHREYNVASTTMKPFTDIYYLLFDESTGKPTFLHIYSNGQVDYDQSVKQMEMNDEQKISALDIDHFGKYDNHTVSESSEMRMYEALIADFACVYPAVDIYDESTYNACISCVHYYSASCVKLQEFMNDWVTSPDNSIPNYKLVECEEFIDYKTGEITNHEYFYRD